MAVGDLSQYEYRCDDREERRELIQDERICDVDLGYGIEVADRTYRAESRAHEKILEAALLNMELLGRPGEHGDGDDAGDHVPEECLHEDRHVSGQIDKERHDGEREGGYEKVVLEPLMVVAGDHANNDMAGDDEDSWKSIFEAEGYKVECLLRGLGENEDIRKLYVEHAQAAVDSIK